MLEIYIPAMEFYDESNNIFIHVAGQNLKLEHSLVSLSKWESIWEKPFLSQKNMTEAETISYIKCMTITQNVNPALYKGITQDIINQVNSYIAHPMTATTFPNKDPRRINREIITAEIIYYWMITLNVPFECQKWHLNKLLTLLNVCNIKSQPGKKMSPREVIARNKALNAERKSKLNTRG